MLLTDLDELNLAGMEIGAIGFSVERLSTRFGGGVRADASVGIGYPLWGWEIESDCLPDDTDYGDLIEGKPRFEYYHDFIIDHTIGSSSNIFLIDFRGKRYTAAFADNDFAGMMQSYDLFGMSGVKLEYARVPGIAYDTDGSVLMPWTWLRAEAITDTNGTFETTWPDWTPNDHDFTMPSSTVVIATNVVNSLPVMRFDETTSSKATRTLTAPVTIYDAFMVVKIRQATFVANKRGILGDGGSLTVAIRGESTLTTLEDWGHGSIFEYRKNGTLLADTGAAPMNVFAVLHFRFVDGIDFTTLMILASMDGFGWYCPLDIAEFVAYETRNLSAAEYTAKVDALLEKYNLP